MVRMMALFVIALGMLVGGSRPLSGEPTPRIYEPLVRSPEYKEAFRLADEGQRLKALAMFQAIADQNPGTTLGAMALFELAYFCEDVPQARAAYRAVVAGWPQSRFEVEARSLLIDLETPGLSKAEWVLAAERLVVSLGGPSLREMQRGDNQRLAREFQRLPLEIRMGLVSPYMSMGCVLIYQLGRYDEGLAVAQFGREAFLSDLTSSGQFAQSMEDAILLKKFGTFGGYQPLTEPPTIRILTPKPGKVKGPRPKIRVEITRGDYRNVDINLGTLEFTLDGRDLKPLMVLRTKINTDLKPNKPFERVRLRARPEQALSHGVHNVVVAINGVRATWSFRVGKAEDDREDCEEDDPEDD